MTPNTISNVVFIALALVATVAQHWLPIPQDLVTFLWTLAGFNGVKTAATSQLAHDAKSLGLTTTVETPTPQPPTAVQTNLPTKVGLPL